MTRAEERFKSLYDSYEPHVYAYCRRRFPADRADDVVADVLLTVWRRIDEAPTGEDALRWMYRIAHLVSQNHRRSIVRKRNLSSRLEGLGVNTPHPVADQVVVRDEVRHVVDALEALPARDREVLKLSVWEHLSAREIGDVLDITPEAATQRLYRARRRLEKEHKRSTRTKNSVSPAAQTGGEW